MTAVVYARYSSDSQHEESIDGQIRECKAFAERQGITILDMYIDRALSAKTDNRPQFQKMIKDSSKKKFDIIIVWKLDRFARNRYDSARYKNVLKKNGVKVISATENISEGSEGILLESVLEGYAEYYSVELSEKVTRGLTENALKCKFNGGTVPNYKCNNAKYKHSCDKKTVKKEWIEDIVVRYTKEVLMQDDVIEDIANIVLRVANSENTSIILLKQQLSETERAIANLMNAIEQGIITTTTKQRMIELENTKEDLELKIIKEELKRPPLTKEGLIFWLQRFRSLDTTKKEHKQRLIDSFVNAVYVYDDKLVLTFNYNEANTTVTLDEVNGSIIECSGAPEKRKQVFRLAYRLSKKSGLGWAFFDICGIMYMVIKMLEEKRNFNTRNDGEIVSLDDLVPKFHLLRKIDKSIDWRKIYPIVEGKYSKIGRPSVDPVVLVKMVLLQHIYGIRSLRQTVAEIEVNVAYRWFIGYGLTEKIPHFSTVSYNFLHRFDSEMFEEIFTLVLNEGIDSGYVKPEVIFIDSTHIKANANRKKQMKVHVPAAVKTYEEQLHKEINEDRDDHGKKPLKEKEEKEEIVEKTVSTTDPESGLFHKGEHQKCFAYEAQTVCDKNNFILDTAVVPGNIHDSVSFDEIYDRVTKRFPQIKVVTADAGYKTPWICKRIFDDGRTPSMPYKRPQTKDNFFKKYEYVYDEYYDCYICPNDKILKYSTTNREGYIERAEDVRHSPLGKDTYSMRSKTIERVFADAKEKHGMRYTHYKGLNQVSNWVRLKFTAMNLKKLAMWKFKNDNPIDFLLGFLKIFKFTYKYTKKPCLS